MNIQCAHIKDQSQFTKSLQGKKLYKDQCVRCFHQPTDQNGLFVCMKCFNGFCSAHRDQHTNDHHHILFTNIVMTLKNKDQKYQITKLAIGKQGGAVGGDQYQTSYSVYCNGCKASIEDGKKALEPQIQSLINTDSPFKKQSIASWENQVLACEHSLTLQQNPVNKDLTKCANCQLSTNLWLCLTCGNTGCGRKNYDGTGGNSHGIEHFEKTKHPLVVKLGTITAEGQASLYCYECNNDVKDQFLKTHMQVLGIDFGSQKKTQKTVTQMNLQLNLNFTLSKQLQSQKNDKLLFGNDNTGINNIGNSCYLNSVVQMLNILAQFKNQYFNKGQLHIKNCKLIPSQCFYCQLAKLSIGLNNGKYSQRIQRTRIINDKQVTSQYQRGINPYDFKLLIAENNAQFCSNRQQDAEEYLQWLFDRLNKQEHKFGQSTTSLFDFNLVNRLVCQQCHNYKIINQKTNIWKFPVPPPSAHDIQAFYNYVEGLKDPDMKKAKACQQPQYSIKFDECLNFLRIGDSVSVKCENCKKNTQFISGHYFKSTPRYLIALANRFVLQKWVPKKLNAILEIPQELNISEFLLSNAKPVQGEQLKQQKKKQYSQENVIMLQEFGYSKNASIRALIATKDNVQAAMNYIMDNFDKNLDAPLEQEKSSGSQPQVDANSIAQIQQMGFQDLQARIALLKNGGNVPQAIQWLFNCGGDVTPYLDVLQPVKKQQNKIGEQNFMGSENPNYKLKAVIVHLGKSVHSGHYVVYIKKNGAWTLFNDEKVVIPETAFLGKGYLYIYQRV